MPFKKFSYEVLIREQHLDSFGHVNNATYLQLYEEARWQIITENGYSYPKIQELQIGPTILNVNLEFKREIRLRQKITIESQAMEYSGKTGDFLQEMKDEEGRVCSRAVFKIALFDMSRRRLIDPTPEWLKAIGNEV